MTDAVVIVLGGPCDKFGKPMEHLALRLETALLTGRKLEASGVKFKYLLTGGPSMPFDLGP
eukprot:SAG31_NODE_6704_length_1917_cov_2.030803_2_plen_61_part_00